MKRPGKSRAAGGPFGIRLVAFWLAATGVGAIDVHTDLQYLPEAAQGSSLNLNTLDIYAPEQCQSCPVLVFIHGGTWFQGDKGSFDDKAKAFIKHGWVYVSVNYRLSPEVQHPVHVQDAAAAVAWLHDNIARFGGDPGRLCLLGHSAGAHLAALLATNPRYLQAHGLELQTVRAVVGLDSAAYDLPSLIASEPENLLFFEMAFGPDSEVWAAASPVNYPAPGRGTPPFLLVYAGDRDVSRKTAQIMAAALRRAGTVVELLHADDDDHVSVERRLGTPAQTYLAPENPAPRADMSTDRAPREALIDRILAFLEGCLDGPKP